MQFNLRAALPGTLALLLASFTLSSTGATASAADGVQKLHWIDLLPKREREGYIPGPPPPNHGYLDGIGDRSFGKFNRNDQQRLDCTGIAMRFDPQCEDSAAGGRMGQAGLSSAVNEALDGKTVRIEGYIVPLEVAPNGKVTEFFFASYVGACIHVPPPPPNQMVYVKVPARLAVGSMYDAYALTGVLRTSGKILGLGGSAYSMQVIKVERVQ